MKADSKAYHTNKRTLPSPSLAPRAAVHGQKANTNNEAPQKSHAVEMVANNPHADSANEEKSTEDVTCGTSKEPDFYLLHIMVQEMKNSMELSQGLPEGAGTQPNALEDMSPATQITVDGLLECVGSSFGDCTASANDIVTVGAKTSCEETTCCSCGKKGITVSSGAACCGTVDISLPWAKRDKTFANITDVVHTTMLSTGHTCTGLPGVMIYDEPSLVADLSQDSGTCDSTTDEQGNGGGHSQLVAQTVNEPSNKGDSTAHIEGCTLFWQNPPVDGKGCSIEGQAATPSDEHLVLVVETSVGVTQDLDCGITAG